MASEFRVRITKDSNPSRCTSNPEHFKAKRGDFVTFDFNEPGARIVFQGESPFDKSNKPFDTPKRLEVRADAPAKKDYTYRVSWPDDGGGVGNGTGEILP
jgi:hypothetical protein